MPAQMKRFPEFVRESMRAAGAAATCLPVQLDQERWETAFFFQLAGPECKEDRRLMRKRGGPLPVGLESDLIETEHAAVVMLRPEVYTRDDDPLTCEILLTPGEGGAHFDALKLLSMQQRICWFFADQEFWIIHSQQLPLDDAQRQGFDELLRDALKHDTMVRMTRRYDAEAGLGEIVRHYELRAGALRSEYAASASDKPPS
ncbi:MAG: hypothetical protein R3337_11975 [Gammaproteobacteria bacterium]|nr:hypothetical protein [Gammaproteobacteria bacterium]